MSIDIAKLKKLVEESLKDGQFSLDTAKLDSPGITVIATKSFPKATLTLSGASIASSDEQSITVKGKGSDLPFKEMDVTAKFYILEENAALTLQASGNELWTLSKSFPGLEDTLGSQVRFSKNIFWLLSDPDDNKSTGLSLDGLIDFAASSAGISTILGINQEALNGSITLKDGGTNLELIDLRGPVIKNVNLWVSKNTDISFGLKSELAGDSATGSTLLPMLFLTASIPFSEGKYHLPLSVRITDLESFVRFGADMTEVINASLDALSDFTGGADLAKTIPADFHIEEYVRFTELFIDFDVKGTKVDMIGLQVDSTSPWKIFTVGSTGKTFTASDVSLRFNVFTPFSGPKPSLFMGGKINLTERASIYVSAGYPNFEVQGYLTEKSELNIREFVENFVGKASGIPENLYVDELGFYLQSGNYSFEVNIDGYWPINLGQSLALSIDELGFSVEHNEAETSAAFNGTFRIGSVDVYVTANYNATGETSGWLFTGETGKGQRIPLGEFTSYLAKTFNAPPPPTWLADFTLQDLATSFNTQNKDFSFFITGNIPVAAQKEFQLTVGFEMKSLEAGGYQRKLSGSLNVGKSVFEIIGTTTPSDSSILAQWKAKDATGYLQFEDIAHAFGMDNVPAIPEGLNLALKEAKLFYNFTEGKQALLVAAESANFGTAIFVAKKINDAWTYVIGVDIKINITLAQLPLVGDDLEKLAGPSGLNGFKLIVATKKIEASVVKEFNLLIKEQGGEAYPQLPDMQEGIEAGVYCALELQLGSDNKFDVQLNTADKKKLLLMAAAETADNTANAYWVDLQRTIGPLYFDRAGVSYRNGRVALLLDASLVFTALKIDLIQLGVSNPLNKFDPDFELAGLNIAFKSGPVQISGGFLKQVVDGVTEYNGSALIGVKAFSLSALGSYASKDGHPSLFIFALMTAPPLGGDPAFFITGLAGGFGYNRGLKLPTIDTVTKFPLTSGFVPGQSGPFSGPDPGKALKVLVEERVVPVQIGQNWLAAGIRFTTYELLESFALLSVALGTDLEIGLIGLSTLSVPSRSPKVVASAQLALNVQILPNRGIVSVEAKLTPASYILSKSCLLTGGFAFYVWTSPNEHEGDFVVTLGGYHPNFTPPAHYPKVPRLGFNWTVTSEVSLKGGLYFALTPTCVMAGGSLEATFQSGSLKAWFIIGADFLIAWKPYYYEAHLYASFGVSYTFRLNLLFTTITKTISVSLGADLKIWGPDFSGVARIHLWIISFDISFGANTAKPAMNISWQDFKDSFLPPSQKTLEHERLYGNVAGVPVPTDTYCIGRVTTGLVEDLTVKETAEPVSWIVNRNDVTLETTAVMPAKEYELIIRDKNGAVPKENIVITNADALAAINKDFGVGMVEVANKDFNSKQVVTLEFEGILHPKVRYEITAIIRNVPKSLWDKRQTGLVKDATVKDVLMGFRIVPVSPVPEQSLPIGLENFQYDYDDYPHIIKPARPVFIDGPENKDGMRVMMETINSEKVKATRLRLVERLAARGVAVNKNINVEQIAKAGEDFIMAPPVLKYAYWKG
ncbi:MAG: hypothetical protein J0G98_09335 [Terrimonas ferruginea]|uniref:DUF6603 domain-containing protein n=1 Tax=Terrimonas ferruginea TaxID=249 RepID=UPI0009263BE8|nr:DUF6603 domain-containing protein [Terrimonas ferruginea]MBN8783257.1 hypothetical protein [Terrimonas ferruginea]OJW39873.1 MAG: hypothetical protein BGO56_03145 [Sphingobacteriales bacterium 48-107]